MFACSVSLTFFLIKSFRSFKVAEFMTTTSAMRKQTSKNPMNFYNAHHLLDEMPK